MLYREAGDFKTSYRADQQTFPIMFDKVAFCDHHRDCLCCCSVSPSMITGQMLSFLPFLIYAIAAIGLNILTGYCGQVSLGSGGFMAVGAYACYKLMTVSLIMNIIFCILALWRDHSRGWDSLWPAKLAD